MRKIIIDDWQYLEEEDRVEKIFVFSILVSVLLHILLLLTASRYGRFLLSVRLPEHEEKSVTFNIIEDKPIKEIPFLDTPDNVSREAPEAAEAISDKSSKAADLVKSEEEKTPRPFSSGDSKHPGKERDFTNIAAKAEAVSDASEEKKAARETPTADKRIKIATAEGAVTIPVREKETPPRQKEETARPEKPEIKQIALKTVDLPIPRVSKRLEDTIDEPISDKESNAEIFDEIEYNVKSDIIGPYVKEVKKRIQKHWYYYVYKDKMNVDPGDTVIIFKIMPDGQLREMTLIGHKGRELDARYGLLAIEKAAPFAEMEDKVAAALRSDGLWMTFEFSYGW
ncbi:MAG: hypothetical protein PHO00_01935 [bacterium]|nr:hypothetical protein [bacterium]